MKVDLIQSAQIFENEFNPFLKIEEMEMQEDDSLKIDSISSGLVSLRSLDISVSHSDSFYNLMTEENQFADSQAIVDNLNRLLIAEKKSEHIELFRNSRAKPFLVRFQRTLAQESQNK